MDREGGGGGGLATTCTREKVEAGSRASASSAPRDWSTRFRSARSSLRNSSLAATSASNEAQAWARPRSAASPAAKAASSARTGSAGASKTTDEATAARLRPDKRNAAAARFTASDGSSSWPARLGARSAEGPARSSASSDARARSSSVLRRSRAANSADPSCTRARDAASSRCRTSASRSWSTSVRAWFASATALVNWVWSFSACAWCLRASALASSARARSAAAETASARDSFSRWSTCFTFLESDSNSSRYRAWSRFEEASASASRCAWMMPSALLSAAASASAFNVASLAMFSFSRDCARNLRRTSSKRSPRDSPAIYVVVWVSPSFLARVAWVSKESSAVDGYEPITSWSSEASKHARSSPSELSGTKTA